MDQYITEYLSQNLFCLPDRRGWDGVRNRAHYQNVNETVCFPNFRARLYQLIRTRTVRALLFLDALCRKNMWKLMQHYFIPCETDFNCIYPALIKLRDFNTVQKIYANWVRRNPDKCTLYGEANSYRSVYVGSNPKTAALFISYARTMSKSNICEKLFIDHVINYKLYTNDNILEIIYHLFAYYHYNGNKLLEKILDTIVAYPKCVSDIQIKMVDLLMTYCRKTLSEHIGKIQKVLPKLYDKYKLMVKNDLVRSMIKSRYNLDVKIERTFMDFTERDGKRQAAGAVLLRQRDAPRFAASGHYHRIMFRDCQIYCPKIFANIIMNNLSLVTFTSVVQGELRIEFCRERNADNSRLVKHFCECPSNPKKQLGITLIWKHRAEGTNTGIITELPVLAKSKLLIDIELGDGEIITTVEQVM